MSISDFKKKIKELNKTSIRAGWFEDSKYPDGTRVAYVATIQEYGFHGAGNNIPARPFMRTAEADHKKQWSSLAVKEITKSLNNNSGTSLDTVGQRMSDDIADKIINGNHEPLSQITLLLRKWKREGRQIDKSVVEEARQYLIDNPSAQVSANTTPLNDTGLMLATLHYNIVKK